MGATSLMTVSAQRDACSAARGRLDVAISTLLLLSSGFNSAKIWGGLCSMPSSS